MGEKHKDSDQGPEKAAPAPAPVLSADPDKELEKKLKQHPHDLDAKADVGNDQSMDASDPPSSSQPGQQDHPVPSSGFPE